MNWIAAALAATAALCSAAGDLLQRRSARREDSDATGPLRLLVTLARAPWWTVGVLVGLLGLGLHIIALAVGELAVVQPVLIAELPLAVLGSACFFRQRLTGRDWTAIGMLAGGLSLFVFSMAPSGGERLTVPAPIWAAGLAIVITLMCGLAVSGWRARDELRGALLSTSAGIGYGLTGVFFATAGDAFEAGGLPRAVDAWQSWAAVLTGSASFSLLQNALAAADLVTVTPGLTLANPIVAVLWGLVVFGETGSGGPGVLGAVIGSGLIIVGVLVLARSEHRRSTPQTSSETGRPAPGSATVALHPTGGHQQPAGESPGR